MLAASSHDTPIVSVNGGERLVPTPIVAGVQVDAVDVQVDAVDRRLGK